MGIKITQRIPQNQLFRWIPEGYSHRSGYFINLAERYSIDGRLLGRRILFHYRDRCLSITFPSVIKKGVFPVLGMPGLLESYGADIDDWGKINNYQFLDKPETIRAWLSVVFVECFAEKPELLIQPSSIQRLAKKVVYALHIINPESIRVPSDEVLNDLCEVKHSVSFNKEGRPQMEICFAAVIDDGEGTLYLKDIHLALSNVNSSVSAPYEMLSNARMNMTRNDTRAAVLNCATSLEVMLKKKLTEYFDKNQTQEELREYILKQADGFSRLVELCKKLKLSIVGLPNVQVSVMKIRNRVIHGGYVPSYEEASIAYKDTRLALMKMNVPMFE